MTDEQRFFAIIAFVTSYIAIGLLFHHAGPWKDHGHQIALGILWLFSPIVLLGCVIAIIGYYGLALFRWLLFQDNSMLSGE